MKLLITGGTGFIGNNLLRASIDQGLEVGVLCPPQTLGNAWRLKGLESKFMPLEADITDKAQVSKAVKSFNPDMIFHLAAYGCYPSTQRDVAKMIETNIQGTLNLIQAAEGRPMINTGTNSEYGIKKSPMKETDSCFPVLDYGITKLSQTLLCRKNQIPTLRLFSAYGPQEEPTRLIPTMIRAKLTGLALHLINSSRAFTYMGDIVEAYMAARERYASIKGEIINIGSPKEVSIQDTLSIIDNLEGKSLKVSWDFKEVQDETGVWYAHISKARDLLGWIPKIDLAMGLKKTYEWWKEKYGKEGP